MIEDRRIAIDGVPIETPATILANLRGVTVDGQPVAAPAPARLFRFHKPAGVLTAERDFSGRRTIYDVLPKDLPRVMPVGRLDLNTEGLLLLTTDGELKRALELPATQVKRTYRARAFGEVSQAQLEDLIEGIEIDGIRYGSIDANMERRTGANVWIEMTLTEGKNREVRRVLEHLGMTVSRLIRTSYGPIPLADMPVGGVDEVRQHDLIQFRRDLKLPADKRNDAPLVTRARPLAAERREPDVDRAERALRRPPGAPRPVAVGERDASGRPQGDRRYTPRDAETGANAGRQSSRFAVTGDGRRQAQNQAGAQDAAERTTRRAPGAARPAAVRKREQPERLETDRRQLAPGADDRSRRPYARAAQSSDALKAARTPGGKPRRTSDSKFGVEKPRVERPRNPGDRPRRTDNDRSEGTLKPNAGRERPKRDARSAAPSLRSGRRDGDRQSDKPRPAGGRPGGSSRPGGPRKGPR